MTVSIVFETHSWSEDNDNGRASGWNHSSLSPKGRALAAELGDRRRDDGQCRILRIGHVATQWGLQHYLDNRPLADLMAEDFEWQLGWEDRTTDEPEPDRLGTACVARSTTPAG